MPTPTLPPPDPATMIVTPAQPARAATNVVALGAWLLVTSGIGAAACSLLPWGQVTTFLGVMAIAGTRGDGKLTVAAGLFVALVGVLVLWSRASYNLVVLGLVGSCAVVAITGYNALDLGGLSGDAELLGVVDVGYGLWLTLAAGIAGILGGALLIQDP